ncbi:hypothetical protein Ancab_024417 [Ancistrocladus abbreviatus]
MEDVNFSDSELVGHVKEAPISLVGCGLVTAHLPLPTYLSKGNQPKPFAIDSYNQLVGVLYNKELYGPDEVALLVTSLKAISGAACYIDVKLHESLLTAYEHVDALAELIIICLPRGVAKKDQVLGRVYSALKDIADLVPLAPSSLLSIIMHRMPTAFTKEAVEIGWDDILSEDPPKGIFEMELEVEETLAAAQKEGLEFVMFHACSLDPERCGVRFAEFLADIFASSNFPLLTR